MERMIIGLFWFLMLLLIYTYCGYPLLLRFWIWLAQKLGQDHNRRAFGSANFSLPTVSILVPAFNEQDLIRQKIENCLALDYPVEKLEIIIASDGSTDETNAMATAYGDNEIRFLDFDRRAGKTNVINKVVPTATGEIIILSDASAMLELDSVHKIVTYFADQKTGAVSGIYRYQNQVDSLRGRGEFLYWQYETHLKILEDRTGSVIGAHGALLAFRKQLFDPLPANAINDDFIIPMRILAKGYRVAYATDAVAVEENYGDSFSDYHRRSRIFVGNLQQIFILKKLLNPLMGSAMVKFCSHKVLRTFSPIFVLVLLILNLFLNQGIYKILLFAQLSFYSLSLLAVILQGFVRGSRLFSMPFYFLFSHLSALVGYVKYILRQQSVTWNRG